MTEETKIALRRYEALKLEAKKIDEELDTLKEIVTAAVPEGSILKGEFGVFTSKKRDKWTYSPETTLLADTLKATQKEEIAKGIATSEPTVFVEYKENKHE